MVLRESEIEEVLDLKIDFFHNSIERDDCLRSVKPFVEYEDEEGRVTYSRND